MNTTKPPTPGKKIIVSIITLAIIIGVPTLLIMFVFKSCNETPATKKPDKMEALIKSETFVERQLKAPSTAKFGWDAENRVQQTNDSTFEVINTVDSQNGMGAMLRQTYTCTIIFSGNDVKCENLQFSE